MSEPLFVTAVREYLAGTRTIESAATVLSQKPTRLPSTAMWSFDPGAVDAKPKLMALLAYVAWLDERATSPDTVPDRPFTPVEWRAAMIRRGVPADAFDRAWCD